MTGVCTLTKVDPGFQKRKGKKAVSIYPDGVFLAFMICLG